MRADRDPHQAQGRQPDGRGHASDLAVAALVDGQFQPGIGHALVEPYRRIARPQRSEEHTSELQSLMRISYAVFCLKKKNHKTTTISTHISMTTIEHNNN